LLELGVLDSLGLGSLLAFIQERFGVVVPDERVVPSSFADIEHVAALVDELRAAGTSAAPGPGRVDPSGAGSIVASTHVLRSGAELHTLQVPGSGSPWVLLPGLGEVADAWRGMLQELAGEHPALALDHVGFGRSVGPTEASNASPTIHDHVAHVLELLEAFAPEGPLVLVGSSAGSMIACELVRRLGGRSGGRVQALVVTGFGLIAEPQAWWSALQRLADEPRAFLAAAFDRPVTLSTEALAEVLSRPAYRSFLDADAVARLPTLFDGLDVPVLVVGGQSDGIIPRDAFVRAAAAIPGSRLEWLARCGHFPHAECADELLHLIRDFLAETTP
jgi:pimeloyl-ACP methyl ester carboxylesterase